MKITKILCSVLGLVAVASASVETKTEVETVTAGLKLEDNVSMTGSGSSFHFIVFDCAIEVPCISLCVRISFVLCSEPNTCKDDDFDPWCIFVFTLQSTHIR